MSHNRFYSEYEFNCLIIRLQSEINISNPKNKEKEIRLTREIIALQEKFPQRMEPFLLEALHSEQYEHIQSAYNCYWQIKEDFPHCWRAYLAMASLLQKQKSYEWSKKILMEMLTSAENVSDDKLPTSLQITELKTLLEQANKNISHSSQVRTKTNLQQNIERTQNIYDVLRQDRVSLAKRNLFSERNNNRLPKEQVKQQEGGYKRGLSY